MSQKCNQGRRLRVNSKIPLHRPGHKEALEVARLFGLHRNGQGNMDEQASPRQLYEDFEMTIRPGKITAVVGPSGAGKSVLLHLAASQLRNVHWLYSEALAKSCLPPVAALAGGRLQQKLALLSQCGLAEATLLITPARRLSGGQLYRLALAKALWSAASGGRGAVVIADEFAASLDAITAENLCRQMRKLVSKLKIALLIASPRAELLSALQPDQVVIKPLGQPPILLLHGDAAAPTISAGGGCGDWPIQRGSIGDYRCLAAYHYVADEPACHKRIYVIRPPGGDPAAGCDDLDAFLSSPAGYQRMIQPPVAAVLVVSPPLRCVRGRNIVTGNRYTSSNRRRNMRLLNAELECISRVIVHPLYRGQGLAVRLIRHALATAQTPFMEALAVMGQINPFFERAGMMAYRLPNASERSLRQRGTVAGSPLRKQGDALPNASRLPRAVKARPYVYYFAATGNAPASTQSTLKTSA